MNDDEQFIFDAIRIRVWSGYTNEDDIHQLIDDILDGDVDEAMLRGCVPQEFEKKRVAEQTWPDETACDRLDRAFDALQSKRIIALQDAGYTMSDGVDDVVEVLHQVGRENVRGYCFFHGQDLERAVDGGNLMLAFGDIDDTPEGKSEIAKVVIDTLQDHGFTTNWNGDPEQRISLEPFPWQRRYSG